MRAPTAPLADRARSPHALSSDVFRFDSLDRERFACGAISEEEEDVFSPVSLRSPGQSSLGSPFAGAGGSPIAKPAVLSPMRVKEEREVIIKTELPATPLSPPRLQVVTSPCQAGARNSAVHRAGLCACFQCSLTGDGAEERSDIAGMLRGASSSSPLSPLTPVSPAASSSQSQSPLPLDYQMMRVEIESQLSELYRRRSHSDSDLTAWIDPPVSAASAAAARCSVLRQGRRPAPRPLQMPAKSGSLESDQSSPQDSPLDLSLRAAAAPGGRLGAVSSPSALAPGWEASLSTAALQLTQHPLSGLRPTGVHPSVPIVRGDVASPTTRESVALRYNLEVCPVVEEMSPGNDVAYVCPVCGQMFSLHDRLAKHMASRHKSKPPDATSKAYVCDTCKRSFARSDMLTRHMRLHTGLKPYTCRACGQVFSRSDHLSTHQRTHTGEKPYKCPQCPYAACRRDMITRHMRTHARYEPGATDAGGAAAGVTSSDDSAPVSSTARSNRGPPRRANSEEQPPTYLRHLSTGLKQQEAPASPGLALQSLSVQSPAAMDTGDVTAEHS